LLCCRLIRPIFCCNMRQFRLLATFCGAPGIASLHSSFICAQAGPKFEQLLREALKLVSGCDCTEVTGCPGCIQFTRCDAYNTVLHKQGAIIVLAITLAHALGGDPQELNSASWQFPTTCGENGE
jgi:Domain of unknown function (DUF1998)